MAQKRSQVDLIAHERRQAGQPVASDWYSPHKCLRVHKFLTEGPADLGVSLAYGEEEGREESRVPPMDPRREQLARQNLPDPLSEAREVIDKGPLAIQLLRLNIPYQEARAKLKALRKEGADPMVIESLQERLTRMARAVTKAAHDLADEINKRRRAR